MTQEIFECPECGKRFKVSGGAFSCSLYGFNQEEMEYNQLEKIDESGYDRIVEGKKRALLYDDHGEKSTAFVVL